MSRIGRNYLQVGFYTEVFFQEKGVRFIAISNDVDSTQDTSSEFAPFLNIMNEWYAKDTSRKIKAVFYAKGMDGKQLTNHAIYGYRKNPDNPMIWIIDKETAAVVRRIFHLTLEEKGSLQIARILHDDKVERPLFYMAKHGFGTYINQCDMNKPYA